jgi:hypothetical protein
MRSRSLTIAAATAAITMGLTLTNAPAAQAYSCNKSGIYTICSNGFKPSDWKPGTQFMRLVNATNGNGDVFVDLVGGGTIHAGCLLKGKSFTFDRDTTGAHITTGTGCKP